MSTEKISKTSIINNNIDHDQISPINGGDIKKIILKIAKIII